MQFVHVKSYIELRLGIKYTLEEMLASFPDSTHTMEKNGVASDESLVEALT